MSRNSRIRAKQALKSKDTDTNVNRVLACESKGVKVYAVYKQ